MTFGGEVIISPILDVPPKAEIESCGLVIALFIPTRARAASAIDDADRTIGLYFSAVCTASFRLSGPEITG
jgi:hypothetical protein